MVRPALDKSLNLSSSLVRICPTDRIFTRAAANSNASGIPSSLRQISATEAKFSAVNSKDGRTICARSTNSLMASAALTFSRLRFVFASGIPSGGRGNTRSPCKFKASRLVAMMRTSVQEFSSSSTRSAQDERRCSQLSRISRSFLSKRCAVTNSLRSFPASSLLALN